MIFTISLIVLIFSVLFLCGVIFRNYLPSEGLVSFMIVATVITGVITVFSLVFGLLGGGYTDSNPTVKYQTLAPLPSGKYYEVEKGSTKTSPSETTFYIDATNGDDDWAETKQETEIEIVKSTTVTHPTYVTRSFERTYGTLFVPWVKSPKIVERDKQIRIPYTQEELKQVQENEDSTQPQGW